MCYLWGMEENDHTPERPQLARGGPTSGQTAAGVICLVVAALLIWLGMGWFGSFGDLEDNGNDFAGLLALLGLGAFVVAGDTATRALTLGQYLQPSAGHLPVLRYVHPDTFKMFEREAQAMGFDHAAVGAMVRSSYHADQQAHRAGVTPAPTE